MLSLIFQEKPEFNHNYKHNPKTPWKPFVINSLVMQ